MIKRLLTSRLDLAARRRKASDAFLAVFALLAAAQVCVWAGLLKVSAVNVSNRVSELIYDLCVGYLVSYVFYVLVVFLPTERRRRESRVWLRQQYAELKLRLIEIYLGAIGDPWDSQLPQKLLDPREFSNYFGQKHTPDQTRWHAVHNGLYEDGLPQIAMECQLFVREVQFTLSTIGFENPEAIDFLNRLARRMSRVAMLKSEYDDIKGLLHFLFSLHCPWSILDGKMAPDRVAAIIESI